MSFVFGGIRCCLIMDCVFGHFHDWLDLIVSCAVDDYPQGVITFGGVAIVAIHFSCGHVFC